MLFLMAMGYLFSFLIVSHCEYATVYMSLQIHSELFLFLDQYDHCYYEQLRCRFSCEHMYTFLTG